MTNFFPNTPSTAVDILVTSLSILSKGWPVFFSFEIITTNLLLIVGLAFGLLFGKGHTLTISLQLLYSAFRSVGNSTRLEVGKLAN